MTPLATMVALLALAAGAAEPPPPSGPPASNPADDSKPAAPSTTPPAAERGPVHEIVLHDLDGKELPLERYAGKPMVIEVWSTSCGPCLKQRQLMSKLAPEYRDKVVFLGASVDKNSAIVRGHASKHPVASEMVEAMATKPLLDLIATREKAVTIPKIVYVDSRGRMTDVGTSVQSEAWMRAMLKNLR